MARRNQPIAERFLSKIEKVESGCWEWAAYKTPHGYGKIQVDGRFLFAHRVSWELHRGPIPDGISVLHKCDNRKCVNPAHLFLGTQADNVRDMVAKCRHVSKRGAAHGRSKLSDGDVQNIRTSQASAAALATRYDVHRNTIWHIRSRQQWKHIP